MSNLALENIKIGRETYEVKKGDRYLLCSDGLSGVLTEKEIKIGLKKFLEKQVHQILFYKQKVFLWE